MLLTFFINVSMYSSQSYMRPIVLAACMQKSDFVRYVNEFCHWKKSHKIEMQTNIHRKIDVLRLAYGTYYY